jgi:HD-like signal output (HDOD) protein
MRDPECSIRDFARIVERDVKLAVDVLSTANSSIYGFDKPVTSFEEAVFRLGFRQCKNLILASCFSTLMQEIKLEQQWIRDVLWKHSTLTAILGVHLNRTLSLGFAGEEYTAGLLHDFGRILLAVLLPNDFSTFDPLDFDESDDVVARETSLIGTNHAELASWYAVDNRLPDELTTAIRYHHHPEAAPSNMRLTALVAVADHLGNYLQRGGIPSDYEIESTPHLKLLDASGDNRVASSFTEVVHSLMEQAVEDTENLLMP